jgi:hypothetical protein
VDNISCGFKEGFAHFRCDVCDFAYNMEDLAYILDRKVYHAGASIIIKYEVCMECMDYIGGLECSDKK